MPDIQIRQRPAGPVSMSTAYGTAKREVFLWGEVENGFIQNTLGQSSPMLA